MEESPRSNVVAIIEKGSSPALIAASKQLSIVSDLTQEVNRRQFAKALEQFHFGTIIESISLFCAIRVEIIEQYSQYLSWHHLAGNRNITWDTELLRRLRNTLNERILFHAGRLDYVSDRDPPFYSNFEFEHPLNALCYSNLFDWSAKCIREFDVIWDWEELSKNTSLPWSIEFVELFSDWWDWSELSANEALPWSEELIDEYQVNWSWEKLSTNEGLPWSGKLVDKYRAKWNWTELSTNPSLPWSYEFISEFTFYLNFESLAGNKGPPWSKDLIDNFREQWDWVVLSRNTELPWSMSLVEAFENCWCWDRWYGLAANPAIYWTRDMLDRFSHRVIYTGSLLSNATLPWTTELVERLYEGASSEFTEHYCFCFSSNTAIPWSTKLLETYRDLWHTYSLSRNTALPWSIELLENFRDTFDFPTVSYNEGVPWNLELIERFSSLWDWSGLVDNASVPWTFDMFIQLSDRLPKYLGINPAKRDNSRLLTTLPWHILADDDITVLLDIAIAQYSSQIDPAFEENSDPLLFN